jgi:hypothetical protein
MPGISVSNPIRAAFRRCAPLVLPANPAPTVPIVSNAAIWMHPLPDASAWPGNPPARGGSTDFPELFAGTSAWPDVAAHTSVFGVYAAWITAVSPATLARTVRFLNQHHMTIEIEAPAMQATAACGSGIEGYVPYGMSLHDFTLNYLSLLKADDADVAYLKVDEPYFWGTVTGTPGACQWPVATVAQSVAEFGKLVHTVYPKAAVGDVEPIIQQAYPAGVVSAIAQWHDAYEATAGRNFPFFFADVDFDDPQWTSYVSQIETATHARGMKFGIIYIGDYSDPSDEVWATKTIDRFETYQGTDRNSPDYVLFQSWEPHPTLCLPETSPVTLTGVIDAYLKSTGR